MKSILKSLFFVAVCTCLALPSWAQKGKKAAKTTDAKISYKITAEGDVGAMLNGSTMEFYFSDHGVRVIMNMMGGMVKNDVITNFKEKKGVMLMDMMGQQKAAKMTEEQMDKAKDGQETPEVKYLNEYKKIAGYKCQKALVTAKGADEPVTVYVTDKIQPATDDVAVMQMTGLKGFPLSFEIKNQGLVMTMEAEEVSLEKQKASLFKTDIPEGYQIMTQEELQQLGGSFGM